MAKVKVDNKLNVVIGTKAQIVGDAGILENSIIVVTDEVLTADEIAYSVEKNVKEAIDDKVDRQDAIASGVDSTALGQDAIALGTDSIALGRNAKTSDTSATALGHNATAELIHSIALGSGAKALGLHSIAIGASAKAEGQNSIAIGVGTEVTEHNVADFGTYRQVRVNETPVNDRDAVSKKYLEDTTVSIIGDIESALDVILYESLDDIDDILDNLLGV